MRKGTARVLRLLGFGALAAHPATGNDLPPLGCPEGTQLLTGPPIESKTNAALGIERAEWCAREGVMHGLYREFRRDGGVWERGRYEIRDGDLYRYFESFSATGAPVKKGQKVNSRAFGEHIYYNPDGTITRRLCDPLDCEVVVQGAVRCRCEELPAAEPPLTPAPVPRPAR